MSPEDIFNAFFGGGLGAGGFHHVNGRGFTFGGVPPGARRRQAQQQQQQQQQGGDDFDAGGGLQVRLQTLWPLMLIVFLFMFLGSSSEEAPYQLRGDRVYGVERQTAAWRPAPPEPGVVAGLPYFVRDHVHQRLRVDMQLQRSIEHRVQADWRRHWTQACREEESERRQLEIAVQKPSPHRAFYAQRLSEFTSPGCSNMQRFFNVGGGNVGKSKGGGGAASDEFA